MKLTTGKTMGVRPDPFMACGVLRHKNNMPVPRVTACIFQRSGI
jgi:hypothetical protein